jgi:hypothetical protein
MDSGTEWTTACRDWTAKAVMEKMRLLAAEAVSAGATPPASGREASDQPHVSRELVGSGPGSVFVLRFQARSMVGRRETEIQFQSVRSEGETFGDPNCIVASTSSVGYDNERILIEKLARLAFDCKTETPCLLVEQDTDGRQMADGRRRVTVEEFVREVLLPVLFPNLLAVDHSRDGTDPERSL